jgi:ribonuclease P protein component
VATLQDQAGAHPRVLGENGEPLGAEDPQQAPEKRKEASGRLSFVSASVATPLTPPQGIGRLRRKDFDRICSRPPADRTRFYKLFADESPIGEGRLGLSVSSRVGKAVARNRVRRRLKAAYREKFHLVPKTDIVIIARPGIDHLDFGELCSMLGHSFSRLSSGAPEKRP